MQKRLFRLVVPASVPALIIASVLRSQPVVAQTTAAAISIDDNDIGGVVASSKGPEAGVWVIAETNDLATGFRKIVVTDDRGRYVVPDLPKANYNVWVRGYGLVDSKPVASVPGKLVNLTAVMAPNARAAAAYYPSNYWFSLIHIPPKSAFPGTGTNGNGIAPYIKNQAQWIEELKTDNCESCHQLGDKATREIPKGLGTFSSSVAAWDRRIQSAQDGGDMFTRISAVGRTGAEAMLADWTDRIAGGEVPPAPPRPAGQERNVVTTEWDWATPKEYFHDEITTDKRHPTLNANGMVYGVHENSTDVITALDPNKSAWTSIPVSVRDPNTPFAVPAKPLKPSPYWGDEQIWTSKAWLHSAAMDDAGRIWFAATIRPAAAPAFCQQGSSHPSAKAFPVKENAKQISMYDPKTKQYTNIDTCAGSLHVTMADDANNTLWFSGPGANVVGWLNTKMFLATHDEQKSQGWTPLILDTNGNGKRDAYVEPTQPIDPTKDKRLDMFFYGLVSSPLDGSIWGTIVNGVPGWTDFPGAIVRVNPGSNPPATTLAEIYQPPYNNPKARVQGYSPRGLDVDRNGVVWTVLASGHLASFDRRKCKGPLNGPNATGQQCPEGWSLYAVPGPQFSGNTDSASADSNYYNFVDQFDTLGLGRNVPIATGNGSDSLLALLPDTGKWVVMRVPYPMGFFSKGMDGRIDDPQAGWKGRGIWSTYATRAVWHLEGGKGTTSKAVHFQIRPDPLAK